MKNYCFYILTLLCLCASTQCTVAQNNSSATDQNEVDYGFPKEYEIGGITVSGTEHLDQAILVSLSGLSIGDKITIPGDDISTAIKTLWKQGLFADVQIYASRIVNDIIFLELKLKELPRLSKYKFEGVKNVELEELRESLPLLAGRILDDNTKNNTVYSVKNYYINKGYLNTVINLKEVADTNRANSVILTIDVRRGKRVKINELVLEGVEQVYPRKLKKVMKETKAKSNFNPKAPKIIWDDLRSNNVINTLANVSISDALNYLDDKIRIRLFSSSKFLKKKYKEDKEAIIAYYNSEGYRDARIIEDTTYLVDETNLNVHLKIAEGKRYYFGDIDWSGNTKYDKEQLARVLNIKKGEIYNSDLLTMRLYADPNGADVSSLYMNDGYLFFTIGERGNRDENPRRRRTQRGSSLFNSLVYRFNAQADCTHHQREPHHGTGQGRARPAKCKANAKPIVQPLPNNPLPTKSQQQDIARHDWRQNQRQMDQAIKQPLASELIASEPVRHRDANR